MNPVVVGLAVLNPSGLFFGSDVLADQGTYQGGERPASAPGEALSLITCADLRSRLAPGTSSPRRPDDRDRLRHRVPGKRQPGAPPVDRDDPRRGTTYYAVVNDPELITAALLHPWLAANVLPALPLAYREDAYSGDRLWRWDAFQPGHARRGVHPVVYRYSGSRRRVGRGAPPR